MNSPYGLTAHLLKDKVIFLPHATVVFSSCANFGPLTSILNFHFTYIISPLIIGLKQADHAVSSIAKKFVRMIHGSAEYSTDLDEREKIMDELRQTIKETPLRKSQTLNFPDMKEFIYSFLLTYPLRNNTPPANLKIPALPLPEEHRWYRGFFVRTTSKNVVFSVLRMGSGTAMLFKFPHFDCYSVLDQLRGQDLTTIINAILLEKSLVIVGKDDNLIACALAMITFLLDPL